MSDEEVFYKDWYADPVKLRIQAARLFLDLHEDACGPPKVDFLRVITMADASIIALVSVKDLSGPDVQSKLQASGLFSLIQCLRNLTVHGEVWASRTPLGRSRTLNKAGGIDESVELLPFPFKLQESLVKLKNDRPRNRRAVDSALQFLGPYVSNEKTLLSFHELMSQGLEFVEKTLAASSR
jgi:hypothetical protein